MFNRFVYFLPFLLVQ